jgi:vacuolar-type H+-ATPase subunit H
MATFLLILLIAAIGALAVLVFLKKQSDDALRRAREDSNVLRVQMDDLNLKMDGLKKYQQIADAEAWAKKVMTQAEQTSTKTLTSATKEAERVVTDAREKAKQIVDTAEKKAQETASDALEAMKNKKQLERTVEALKNVVDGYGDKYIMPTYTFLDELADEFGFDKAGQELKTARDRIREMVKDGTAAACDYVEDNRRTTAVNFVLDAFNGKVDTILADVRHDNAGTLKKRIEDAFTLVNQNGQAFRNARITKEYLDARLEELRWAVVAQELKLKDREEQRAIKEKMREEERVQREIERALKEAEKDEELLRKAMEKARKDVEKASEDQKAQYEAKLSELSEKLRLAEEKNQRALSMAQQTKLGHVYIISNVGSFGENVFKIGLTRRLEPLDRVRELGDASVPFEFDVHALIRYEDAPALETALHKKFIQQQINKVNPRKEFFRVELHDIKTEVERMGIHAQWTIAADCREWKETQAIERAMKDKTLEGKAWMDTQLKGFEEARRRSFVKETTE